MIDYERAKQLFDIIEAAGRHGGKYNSIAAAATQELDGLLEALKAPAPAEPIDDEETRRL